MAYMHFRMSDEDQHKLSFHVPGGQHEFVSVPSACTAYLLF
jgi:hypothetical protein